MWEIRITATPNWQADEIERSFWFIINNRALELNERAWRRQAFYVVEQRSV